VLQLPINKFTVLEIEEIDDNSESIDVPLPSICEYKSISWRPK